MQDVPFFPFSMDNDELHGWYHFVQRVEQELLRDDLTDAEKNDFNATGAA